MALGLAGEGARVVVAARTETESGGPGGTIHTTVERIQEIGGQALPIRCDVTREESVEAMVRAVLERFGTIDVLINNAGIAFPAACWEMPLKRWELVLRVNLTGAFICGKAVLPTMMEKRSGSIINISSVQARSKGLVDTGVAYGVSKAALERLTTSFATELGKFNIAVNCLKPKGSVVSEGMTFLHKQADRSRWDTPEKMVKAAIFLAGQDATGMSGMIATDEEICAWHGL
jgi:NAD(P)-dependent dehydrogenase (short-subunit alcohol dehydrogenase family)